MKIGNPNFVLLLILIAIPAVTIPFYGMSFPQKWGSVVATFMAMYLGIKISCYLVLRRKPESREVAFNDMVITSRLILMPVVAFLVFINLELEEVLGWLAVCLTVAAIIWATADMVASSRKKQNSAPK